MTTTPAANEQLLIVQAQAGDADAYCALVSHYQSQVVRLIYRMLGDRTEALDLAQDLRKQARLKKGGSDLGITQIDHVMDEIETLTTDLDALLTQASTSDPL